MSFIDALVTISWTASHSCRAYAWRRTPSVLVMLYQHPIGQLAKERRHHWIG